MLICNLYVPDDVHYEVVKAVLEKVEEIHSWKVVLLYPASCVQPSPSPKQTISSSGGSPVV